MIQREINVINRNTSLIRQEADNNITLIYAQAHAQSIKIRETAEAEAFKIELEGYA